MAVTDVEQGHFSSVAHPQSAAEAAALYGASAGKAQFAAGGTLLRTQWEAGTAAMPRQLIDLSRLPGISGIEAAEGGLRIGAMTTLSECRGSGLLRSGFPLLQEAVRAIAAPSIRNLATIGGNVVYGVGDTLPALLVYNALLHWHDGSSEAAERLEDWLAHPRKDRVLIRIELPFSADGLGEGVTSNTRRLTAFHKIGRREAFTPSVVTVAVDGLLDESGVWRDMRIALGGGQTVPARMPETEDFLLGKVAADVSLSEAHACVMNEYKPIGDAFASEQYRKQTAANLVAAELWRLMSEGDAGKGGTTA